MDNNQRSSPVAKTDCDRVGSSTEGGSGSDEIGETQDEEPSSSSLLKHGNVETELDNFRRVWQREIEISPSREKGTVNETSHIHATDPQETPQQTNDRTEKVEEMARHWFLCGVQAEQCGKLQEAISFYRRAVQLVPDIEFRIAENSKTHSNSITDESDDSSAEENSLCDEDDVDDDFCSLAEKFQKIASKSGSTCICQLKHEQKSSHISTLPPEIFIYILKWVVSDDLDLLSLEQVSKVCRGFYLCARDAEIWRLACLRIWGVNSGTPNKYGSWRNMFIQRPHLAFHGAYISKTTYVRYGEPSFQDTNYRPCYLVEYFRYLRFFPEGLVLMLTTPDDPYQSLAKLRHRRSRYQNIMYGRYKLVGSTVMAVVKKPKGETITPGGLNYYRYRRQRQANLQEACDQTFHLELEVRNIKGRFNCQLAWHRYSIHMVYRNGQETVSDFDLTPANFPPFWFSRVKSYTAESESPLE